MLWGPTCLFCMCSVFRLEFHCWILWVCLHSICMHVRRDGKDFGVKDGRGGNILREMQSMSLSPMAHTPWDVRCPSKVNNMTALLSGISII